MKPSIPKGTRDFAPEEMMKRNHLFSVIRSSFELFGYQPLETPSMENLSTLMGKYGEEGDKLIFKILDSGDFLSHADQDALSKGDSRKFSQSVAEKALRYDLTVPFARFVVMHQHELTFPFRRYQIQPVWRADRPQKGRYREFYQCDADIIGSDALLCELELLQLIDRVFSTLGLKVKVLVNNRKILSGIAELIGESERITDLTIALDKLDKIGIEKVRAELVSKGFSESAQSKLDPLLSFNGGNAEKLDMLGSLLSDSVVGSAGVAELKQLLEYTSGDDFKNASLMVDISLARGLSYYTGAIIEVKVDDPRSHFGSSICGGGRYDDLTGVFGLTGLSGVGISFGADRIVDVMDELMLFSEGHSSSTRVLVVNFGEESVRYGLGLVRKLRAEGLNAELYPDAARLKKQFAYADQKRIPFALVAGPDEQKDHKVVLKNMKNGTQVTLPVDDVVEVIQAR